MGIAPKNPAPFPGSSWTNLSSTVKPPPSFTDPTPIGPYPLELPGGGTRQLEPKPWFPNYNDLSQRLRGYLGSLLQGWQNQYRGLGNTSASWYDWVSGQANAQLSNWMTQNFTPPTGFNWDPQSKDMRDAFSTNMQRWMQDWLRQNSVNYTNPVQMPMPRRMTLPVTDWTRLAGPGSGIASGFAERATKSPWAADYRGGAFGPTARTPSWTVPPPSGGLRPQI